MVAYTNYPSDARVRREAEALAEESGLHVTFFALKEHYKPETYRMNGVIVRELDISKYQGNSKKAYILSYLKFMASAFTRLNQLLFAGRLDIVHVHNMPNFMIFSAILPRMFGKKIILDIHDSMPETYLSKFGSKKSRYIFKLLCAEESCCCRFANKVVCVNHIQQNKLISRGLDPEKILVLLNVPDPKIFRRVDLMNFVPHHGKVFKLVYHGTLSKRLGIDLALRAVSILRKDLPHLQFHVLGKGDDLDEFVELSKKLGVEDQVFFNKKIVPLEELGDLIGGMDVGVIANRKDPATELMLPVKMLEYMVLGIPVVAPSLQAIQYYFDKKMVQYYEPENVDSLAGAIRQLYQEKDRKKAQGQASGRFFDTYGWEKHKFDLIDLYRQLIK